MAPNEFEDMIRDGMQREKNEPGTGIKFTNGKDATEIVIPQYRKGFHRLMSEVTEMAYGGLKWGDNEVQVLARALAYAHASGSLAQLKVSSLPTALLPCFETWHVHSSDL